MIPELRQDSLEANPDHWQVSVNVSRFLLAFLSCTIAGTVACGGYANIAPQQNATVTQAPPSPTAADPSSPNAPAADPPAAAAAAPSAPSSPAPTPTAPNTPSSTASAPPTSSTTSAVPPAGPVPPAQAQTFHALQSAGDWQSCNSTSCAGGGGHGTFSMQQGLGSPSLSGNSMKLANAGVFANALWWHHIGPNTQATNFLWQFDFQVDDASLSAAQALEFDMFQFLENNNYMMGSECNYASGYWDVWDAQNMHWRQTSIACPKFQPGVWHHVQWVGQRSPDANKYTFVTLTVDGVDYPVNKTYSAQKIAWKPEIGVQFQLDVNATGKPYSEWVDNVTLTV